MVVEISGGSHTSLLDGHSATMLNYPGWHSLHIFTLFVQKQQLKTTVMNINVPLTLGSDIHPDYILPTKLIVSVVDYCWSTEVAKYWILVLWHVL